MNEYLKEENVDYIFDSEPKIYNFDLNYIASIELFFEKNGYIKENDIEPFLDYFITNTRMKVAFPFDPVKYSYRGGCSVAQSILNDVFLKISIPSFGFNVGKMFTKDKLIHQLDIITVPILVNEEVINKSYLLDPTFRQYCISEENRFQRYNEEGRYSVNMSTPHPGYFLNLNDDKRKFANKLIEKGYFEVTDENLKTYFDSFVLYLTPKEKYSNQSQVGKIDSTIYSASDYQSLINKSIDEFNLKPKSENVLLTPLELITKNNNKLINKIKSFLKINKNEEVNIKRR